MTTTTTIKMGFDTIEINLVTSLGYYQKMDQKYVHFAKY